MKTIDPRHEEQVKTVQFYIDKAPLKCTLVLSTGIGKCKITIDILRYYNPKFILILVNSTILRDINWEEEFRKFNAMDLFAKTKLVTYQAAYKWRAVDKDLKNYFIIADEVDFAGDTEKLSEFFYQYPFNRTLGLTGFITDRKKDWFSQYLPVLKELKATDAQDMNILNRIHFVYVKYDLSSNPIDVVVEYVKSGKKKLFTQSENNAYDYQQKKIQHLIIEQSIASKEYLQGITTDIEYSRIMKSSEYKLKRTVQKRADLLLNAKSSQYIARKLLKYLLGAKPASKIIIFSKRTLQSLAICGLDNIYSGLITKKQANQYLHHGPLYHKLPNIVGIPV